MSKTGKAPAFQFYAADWLADENVALMTLEEEGAYIHLLAYCWREGSIPKDPMQCSRLAKNAPRDCIESVQQMFAVCSTDTARLVHPRLERERAKQQSTSWSRAEAGKRSGESRRKTAVTRDAKRSCVGTVNGSNCEQVSNNCSGFAGTKTNSSASAEDSVDASRQTLDGTPSASDGPKKEQESLGSFSFSNNGDAKRQPQELAQQQEIVGDQPDWMLTPSEIEQEKAFIESAGKILDRWQRTRNGKRGVARIRTLKTGKQILGDISPNDKKALRSFLPNRLDAAIEALEAIDEGAIGFNANPIGLQFFANNIDRILAGSLAEFDQSRKRTRTDDIKDNLAEVRSELHEFASNPKTQQKRLS